MSAARKLDLISVEEYLDGELVSPIKHEYRGGFVYAMAGARVAHNDIAASVLIAVGSRLRGKPCRPYGSDMKVRVPGPSYERFYYPDVFVVCESNPPRDAYQDKPVVIFEVLSKATRRIDEGEKLEAYLTIPSLAVYVLVEQERPLVAAYRRSQGFVRELYEGLDDVLPLPEIATEMPLAEIYERIEKFTPEPEVED